MPIRVGLAMLQGARHEHAQAITAAAEELEVDIEIKILRTPDDLLDGIDALILPGGESTTMRIASSHAGLLRALYRWMEKNPLLPVLGTCAGAILLCSPSGSHSPFLDANISRNAWGRQADSFQAPLSISLDVEVMFPAPSRVVVTERVHLPLSVETRESRVDETFPGIFIRAPRFSSVGEKSTVVAELDGGEIVGVRQNSRIGLTFHPELTTDHRFHRWIISKAAKNLQVSS